MKLASPSENIKGMQFLFQLLSSHKSDTYDGGLLHCDSAVRLALTVLWLKAYHSRASS